MRVKYEFFFGFTYIFRQLNNENINYSTNWVML